MDTLTTLPRSLLTAFGDAFPGHNPDVFVRSPGRVNLLGGHVDMHGGAVINIAINREVWLAAAYGAPDMVQLHAADLKETVTLSLKRLDDRTDIVGNPLPRWALYPAGVAWALQRRRLTVNGINAAFLGNVVMRAGLSSSAAVETAFAIAWQSLEGWRLERHDLAQVGVEAEREYLGLGSGIQDQFTCLHARGDQALWLDCHTLEHSHTMLPPGVQVVVCDTRTRRELAGSGYNERAQDAHAAFRTIKLIHSDANSLRDISFKQLCEFETVLAAGQFRRARHVVTEIARVQAGFDALRAGDVAAFGALMNESYWSARDDYGSSSVALDLMWQIATEHAACYGARYSGGGEAGAVVALVDAHALDDFIATVSARYEALSGQEGSLFPVTPSEGAGVFI